MNVYLAILSSVVLGAQIAAADDSMMQKNMEQGYPMCCKSYSPAPPARIYPQCGQGVFFSASFIYWYVGQDGMDLAIPTGASPNLSPPPVFTTLNPTSNGSQYVFQNFSFNPGLKLGVGYDFGWDDWVGELEYTGLYETTNTSTMTAPADPRSGTTGVFMISNWYTSFLPISTMIESEWKVDLSIIDATISRPYYQGCKLSILPQVGLRGLILNQHMNLSANLLAANVEPCTSDNHSNSWGLGPRAGLESHWLLGSGFRLEGEVAGSLLFVQYTKVFHSDNLTFLLPLPSQEPSALFYKNYNTVRPIVDFSLGIGWGKYFYPSCNQRYHFDFAATYDFTYLWGQNMMRALMDNFLMGSGSPQDLYLHGLTLTARFDF